MPRRPTLRAAALCPLLLLVVTVRAAEPSPPDLFRYNGATLAQQRDRYRAGDASVVAAINDLKAAADKAITGGPWSVTFKKQTLPGLDKHDYVSLAAYYWPNPDTPNGLPYVQRDGQRNPEFAEYDAKPLMQLTDHADVLALAAYFTGERRYADRCALLIKAWFLDGATRMRPHLNHAQLRRGINDGTAGGVIESRRFVALIDDASLLRGSGAWTEQDDAALRAWIGEFRQWLKTGKVAVEESTAKNNHGSWYDYQAAAYAIYAGDHADARRILENVKQRIAEQIEPDGSQPLEHARTKSFWYCEFNLAALAILADFARRPEVNVDLWNYQTPDGRSLRKAIDWLVPYATAEKPWPYKNIEGFSSKELIVPFRRAEAAWNTTRYEPAIAKLKGQDVQTDDDIEHPLRPVILRPILFPPPAADAR